MCVFCCACRLYFNLETVAIIIPVYVLSEVCMCARVCFYYGRWGRLMYSNVWCLVQMGSPVDALGFGHAQFLGGKGVGCPTTPCLR